MATIITKNSSTASSVPLAAQLVQGELAVNVTDKRLFTENSGGTVVELGTNPSSLSTGALAYTGSLTGGTGVVNLGSGQVYKDASGNVGIGTSSPASRLHVIDALAGGQLLVATNQTNATEKYGTFGTQHYTNAEEPALGVAVQSNVTDNTVLIGGALGEFNAATQVRFYTAANNTTVSGSERMRIDSSGNVGIGTSSPQAKLQVLDSIKVSSADQSGGRVVLGDGGSTAFNVGIARWNGGTNSSGTGGIGYFSQGTGNVGGHFFYTGDAAAGSTTERARIDSSGNLYINQTSGINGTARVGVSQECSVQAMHIWNNTAGGAATNNIVLFYRGSTLTGYIQQTGTSTLYGTVSDYRLKENIEPMTGALSKVAALKPVTYKWKVNGSDGQGFIAHELQAVVPDCVTGEKDAVDADGNPQYQGIDTSFLVATLAAAIQELKAIVDTQAARITALESI